MLFFVLGSFFCISIMESFFPSFPLYQNMQGERIYRCNDLQLCYPLLEVQMSFIRWKVLLALASVPDIPSVKISFFIPKCYSTSFSCSIWLVPPKPLSILATLSLCRVPWILFLFMNSLFSVLLLCLWKDLYLNSYRHYIVCSVLFWKDWTLWVWWQGLVTMWVVVLAILFFFFK